MDGPTTTWRLFEFEQGLREPESELRSRACAALGVAPEQLAGFRIVRRSVDARKQRGALRFSCQLDLVLPTGLKPQRLRRAERSGKVREPQPAGSLLLADPSVGAGRHVVVVGSGPAGIFSALTLALNGARVTVLERGARLEERGRKLVRFHRRRELDPETNLLYGEGGAGTYSDGKVYTRVDDPLEVPCLTELVRAGAPADILFDSRAHIGTDRLHRVLPVLRARLEDVGVTFAWDTRFEELSALDGAVRAVRTSRGELECDAVVLALGHSARDSQERLMQQGLIFEAKPFQFGVRVEHPQELITRGRYGAGTDAELLGPAPYSLVCKRAGNEPAAHSFCMCPGGKIVASVNEAGYLCTNGMSNSKHSSRYANAALVTTLGPTEFAAYGSGPFAGVELQRHFERVFFEAGGNDYCAPAQRVPDFLAGRSSRGVLQTSYTFGTCPGRIDELLPDLVTRALRRALERFERMLPGFASAAGILVGVEARSSGPVRTPRDRDTRLARGWSNVYPVGEGAGYAGGIMSAALDGAKSAHAWLESLRR